MGVSELGSVGLYADQMKMVVEERLRQVPSSAQEATGDFKQAFSQAMGTVQSNTQVNVELGAPPVTADEETQLSWTAQQLEIMFMQELFKGMRSTVPEGGLFEQSFSLKTYQEMLDAEQAKAMAIGGGIGLGEVILKQLRG